MRVVLRKEQQAIINRVRRRVSSRAEHSLRCCLNTGSSSEPHESFPFLTSAFGFGRPHFLFSKIWLAVCRVVSRGACYVLRGVWASSASYLVGGGIGRQGCRVAAGVSHVCLSENARHGENHHGHPIYREVGKVQPHSKYEIEMKTPAEYKYCKGEEAWVFTHPDIYKTIEGSRDSKDCNWLARSPTPDDFDLLGIQGHWDLWTGAISKGDVSIDDGRCKDDQSCNLNGKCEGGKCVCAVRENVSRRCSEYFLCTN